MIESLWPWPRMENPSKRRTRWRSTWTSTAGGRISIARTFMNQGTLINILKKVVGDYGQTVPVIIRGDSKTRHEDIKKVMDACVASGLWKVKFAALKEKG